MMKAYLNTVRGTTQTAFVKLNEKVEDDISSQIREKFMKIKKLMLLLLRDILFFFFFRKIYLI